MSRSGPRSTPRSPGPRWSSTWRAAGAAIGPPSSARWCKGRGPWPRPAWLVYASSSAALYLGGGGTVEESHGVDPRPEKRSLYSRAKIAAEALLLRLHRERGLPVVILRPAVVVGQGGLLAHGGLGQWPSPTRCVGRGRGDTPIPFVLVKDVVQAFLAAMEAPRVEGMAFNLAGDVRPTACEYLARIAESTGRDFRFHPRSLATHQALETLKWLVKAAAHRKENPFPSWRDLRSRTMARQIDSRLAKRHLGWVPTNDPVSFLREAIGPHVRHPAEGDLRHSGTLW
jgi:nucleoside-diphosphate-sugar epimerase